MREGLICEDSCVERLFEVELTLLDLDLEEEDPRDLDLEGLDTNVEPPTWELQG